MELVIKPYDALPCALEVFTINSQKADKDDFGESGDYDTENAPEYGCGCHKFIAYRDNDHAHKAMEKYNITLEEYHEICSALEEKLYVGECGWCI